MALYEEALALSQELGDRLGVAYCLEGLAEATVGTRPLTAARLFGAAETLRDAIGIPLPPGSDACDRRVAEARATLGEAAFAAAWEAGRGLRWEAATAEALATAERPVAADGRSRQ